MSVWTKTPSGETQRVVLRLPVSSIKFLRTVAADLQQSLQDVVTELLEAAAEGSRSTICDVTRDRRRPQL